MTARDALDLARCARFFVYQMRTPYWRSLLAEVAMELEAEALAKCLAERILTEGMLHA